MNNQITVEKEKLQDLYKVLTNYPQISKEQVDNEMKKCFGEDVFKPTDIRERVKTFEDAVSILGEEHPYVVAYNELLNTATRADLLKEVFGADMVAYMKLRIIVAALNEGWKPKFDGKEWRYSVYFILYTEEEYNRMTKEEKAEIHLKKVPAFVGAANGGSSCGVSALYSYDAASRADTDCGGCLALRTSELAIYCGKQWIDLWADYYIV